MGDGDNTDITPGDVEGVREGLLDEMPADAPEQWRAGYIDALIAMDRRLTDPDAVRDRNSVDDQPYPPTD